MQTRYAPLLVAVAGIEPAVDRVELPPGVPRGVLVAIGVHDGYGSQHRARVAVRERQLSRGIEGEDLGTGGQLYCGV